MRFVRVGLAVYFESEARDAQRALRDLERATARKDREVRAAIERWEASVARAIALGEPLEQVAAAADLSTREVRAMVRRCGEDGRPVPQPSRCSWSGGRMSLTWS
jgi:hypothetical protein